MPLARSVSPTDEQCRVAVAISAHVAASPFLKLQKLRDGSANGFAPFVPSMRLDPNTTAVKKVGEL